MARRSGNPDVYRTIWQSVRRIPPGKVATYGQVAAISGLSGQARLVGYALHNLPHNSNVPWHRVINAKGQISFSEGSRSYAEQKGLLEDEGIMFDGRRIGLERYGWKWTRRGWKTTSNE